MKLIENIFAIVIVAFIAYMGIDFNAKEEVPVKPKTPTFSQFLVRIFGI